jgi:hypothetical protein
MSELDERHARIEVGTQTLDVVARIATGAEREIPVVILEPAA